MRRKMTRTLLTLSIILMFSTVIITQFSATANAKPPEVTYNSEYKYTVKRGVLGGADYEIFMPDNWNGQLVIGCKGYTPTYMPLPLIDATVMHTIGLQFMASAADFRFAYATSTYGTNGFCMQVGMICTHQLTQYVIDNFHVTGKVFLIGLSMGGQIALMLAHKYPDLYAGVLDVCGNKDTEAFYNYWKGLANLPPTASEVRTYLNGPPAYLPTLFTSGMSDIACLTMRASAAIVLADVEAECNGTPESKPQAYERISPTCCPELTLPVISMVARNDALVPIQHFNDYYDAVQTAGCIDNYRCYRFTATHCDATIIANVQTYFNQLFNWATGGPAPPTTPKPYP
jgi:hypothetical protein